MVALRILKTSINELYTIHSIFVPRKSDKHAFRRLILKRINQFSFCDLGQAVARYGLLTKGWYIATKESAAYATVPSKPQAAA
jgi:hypothetical protein